MTRGLIRSKVTAFGGHYLTQKARLEFLIIGTVLSFVTAIRIFFSVALVLFECGNIGHLIWFVKGGQ